MRSLFECEEMAAAVEEKMEAAVAAAATARTGRCSWQTTVEVEASAARSDRAKEVVPAVGACHTDQAVVVAAAVTAADTTGVSQDHPTMQ
jgi:hypothetical protein